jgi:tryptophan-rich sensory protein
MRHTSTTGPVAPRGLALVGWIAATLAAGGVGGAASAGAADFYAELARPAWAPPGWLFGPVWTVLYVLMGIAAWLVWRERGWAGARAALLLFAAQLACNALWTWLFFTWRRGGLALAEIVVLAALIVATMVAFARVRALAAVLLVPYLAWVLFATALTASVWRRNPGLL